MSSDANLGAVPSSPTAGNIVLNGGTLEAKKFRSEQQSRHRAGPDLQRRRDLCHEREHAHLRRHHRQQRQQQRRPDRHRRRHTRALGRQIPTVAAPRSAPGTLKVGTVNPSGTGYLGTGPVTDNGSLVFDEPAGTSSITVGAISGSALTQEGTDSTIILTGADSY